MNPAETFRVDDNRLAGSCAGTVYGVPRCAFGASAGYEVTPVFRLYGDAEAGH